MKRLLLLTFALCSVFSFSQDIKATTEDGRKVILKTNKTWEFAENQKQEKRKITLEFTHKDPKKQFSVTYDALDSKTVDSGSMLGGLYNSGWKKSIYVDKMENQITFKVATMKPGEKEIVTMNVYIDDKLVKTITEKTKFMADNPTTLIINLEDYK